MGFMGPVSVLLGNDPGRTKPEDFIVTPSWVPFQTTVAYRYFEIMKIADI
ncbi:UDP-glycosyltransferase 91A1-like, partial [Trifolium medium]|nr:UDP-glycosyltransferase 91A1-like [Trifolium medium]